MQNLTAGGLSESFKTFIGNVEKNIANPLIMLLFGIALVVFMWGVVKYIANADNEIDRKEGSNAIIYGIVGMFIMFSVFGLMNLVGATLTDLFK